MTFTHRRIEATIVLGSGDFGDAGVSNTVTLSGHRMSANIVKGNSPSVDTAEIRIWGLTPNIMNSVSRLGKPLEIVRNNSIQIRAGDDTRGLAMVFQGIVQNATQDFSDSPNVCLNIGGQAGALSAMAPVKPVSFQGQADVATLMTTIAASMKPPLTLENNGVDVVLSNPYYAGTATQQMEEVAEAANIYASIDSEHNTLAIWPKDGSRSGQAPLISLDTGLVGFPTFADVGIGIKVLYSPGLRLGGTFNLTSRAVPSANGSWVITMLSYELECEMPGGKWFSNIVAKRPASAPAAPQ